MKAEPRLRPPEVDLPNRPRRVFLNNSTIALFVFAVIAVIALGGVAWQAAISVSQARREVAETHDALFQLTHLLSDLQDVETGSRGFVITGDEGYLEPYQQAFQRLDSHVAQIETLFSDDPDQTSRLIALKQHVQGQLKASREQIAVRREKGFEAARQVVATGVAKTEMDRIRAIISELNAVEQRLLSQRNQLANAATSRMYIAFTVAGVSILGLLGGLAYMVNHNLKQREFADEERRKLLARVSDAFMALDPTWNFTYVNERAGQIFGRPPEEMIGKNICTEFPEGIGQPFHVAYERAMADQVPIELEEYYEPFERWFENRIYPSPEGLSVFFHDNTEKKQAELNLRESERRMSDLLENVRLVALMLDLEGRVTFCNEFLLQLMDRTREEMIGFDWFDNFVPPERADVKTSFLKALAKGELPNHFENLILTKSGERREILWSNTILRDVAGDVIGTARIGEDITDRRKAEAALRESESRLRLVLDGLGPQMFVGLLSTEGKILVANRSALQAAGLSLDEVLGKPVEETYWLKYSDTVAKRFRAAVERAARGETVRYDEQIRVAGGKLTWVAFSVEPLRNESGNIEFVVPSAMVIDERKRVEAALRESEARIRNIFNQASDGIFLMSGENRFLDANARGMEMLGYSRDELMNMTVADVLVPHERPRLEIEPAEMMAGKPHLAEWEHLRKDGSTFPAEVSARRLNNNAFTAIVRDLTERKQTEKALRESETRLRLAVESSDIGLFDWDLLTNEVYFSPIWKRQIGYEDHEISNQFVEWESRVHPDDLQGILGKIKSFIEKQWSNYEVEFRFRHHDGTYRWILTRASLIKDESGKPVRMMGSHLDITERKRAEAEHHRLSTILENSLNEVYVFDGDTLRFEYVNAGARRNLGYSLADLIKKTPLDLKPEYDEPKFRKLIAPLRDGSQEQVTFETVHRRADGTLYPVQVLLQYMQYESRSFFVAIILDITKRRQAEAELRTSSEQLRALSARLQSAREEEGRRIAREIHDELGGALTGLKWDLERIDRGLAAAANNNNVTSIRKKIPEMTGMINSTIEVVRRISSELRPSVLDDLGLVAAIEWQADQFQQRTGLEVRCDSSADPDLNRDAKIAVFRVFQEILTNILRHAQATRVNVSMRTTASDFTLEVRDNGCGITEEQIRNLRSLGLLGMRERVHLVGGEVSITGVKGKGTRVVIEVPLDLPSHPPLKKDT